VARLPPALHPSGYHATPPFAMPELPRCDSQWNDFLVRRYDAYAMAKYDLILRWLGDLHGATVLVAGCGSGELAVELARAGAEVTAFDVDAETVELTREAERAAGVTMKTSVARLETFEGHAEYDVVVATDVLEHIESDRAAAQRVIELTRPGGRIVITVPAAQWLFGYHDEVLGHFRRYGRRTLLALFEAAVRVEKLRTYGFGLIPVALLYSRILRRPYPTAQVGVAAGKISIKGAVIRAFFKLEQRLNLGLGTSLLLFARRP
jgi:2-polyprenyl-3-methyl-5-hydroxy-6-metoxy-1,4-benzoquinol methylase